MLDIPKVVEDVALGSKLRERHLSDRL